MSLSTQRIAVSAGQGDPAPSTMLVITVSNRAAADTLYLRYTCSTNGVATVTAAGASGNTSTIAVSFRSPSTLGPGTYEDTLTLAVCYDEQCNNPIGNSPQSVAVNYAVTVASSSAIRGAVSLSPASALAGGSAS